MEHNSHGIPFLLLAGVAFAGYDLVVHAHDLIVELLAVLVGIGRPTTFRLGLDRQGVVPPRVILGRAEPAVERAGEDARQLVPGPRRGRLGLGSWSTSRISNAPRAAAADRQAGRQAKTLLVHVLAAGAAGARERCAALGKTRLLERLEPCPSGRQLVCI